MLLHIALRFPEQDDVRLAPAATVELPAAVGEYAFVWVALYPAEFACVMVWAKLFPKFTQVVPVPSQNLLLLMQWLFWKLVVDLGDDSPLPMQAPPPLSTVLL